MTFDHVVANDTTVRQILMAGGSLEDCICALVEQKSELFKRVMELELIAPFRVRDAAGNEFVYRAPAELCPDKSFVVPKSALGHEFEEKC